MYYRKQYEKNKLKNMVRKSSNYYICQGYYFDYRKQRIIKINRGTRSGYLKRYCNKRFRKNKKQDYLSKGNQYRRFTDFWWLYW